MKLDEADLQYINIMMKGEPSAGKSIAAASFPNAYIFDFESRIRSVRNYYMPRGRRDIEFDTYRRTDFQKFQDKVNLLATSCKYDTVIFDSLTSAVDLLLYHVAELRGTGKGSVTLSGMPMNTIEDYNAETTMLNRLMAHLRDIKAKHKILIAHVIQTEQKALNGKSVITRSLMTAGKKAGAKVPAYFDEIYHLQQRPDFNGKPEFVALTMNTGDDFARTCMSLPREIVHTNLSFYELVKGEYAKPYNYPVDEDGHTIPPDVRPANDNVLGEPIEP